MSMFVPSSAIASEEEIAFKFAQQGSRRDNAIVMTSGSATSGFERSRFS
jgi:hypothetical protein